MNRFLFSAVLSLTCLAGPAFGETVSQLEIEQRCRSYAIEDGILEEELKAYLQECIEVLSTPASEESEEKEAESGNKKDD
jgi:hypothetical protein